MIPVCSSRGQKLCPFPFFLRFTRFDDFELAFRFDGFEGEFVGPRLNLRYYYIVDLTIRGSKMDDKYPEVLTRFLGNEERLVLSQEQEMPLVIEAKKRKDASFLQAFLAQHTAPILEDLAQYGAILLRGFDIESEDVFEQTVLSIKNFRGISEVFMSEEGRVLVDDSNYVFHTNAVYKTGGTLYLGGFHSENYYSTDVPTYISFCCLKPSTRGGETGLINTEKVYQSLNEDLKAKLGKNLFCI